MRRWSAAAATSRTVLWNGRDPILKERLFGLTNGEGNQPWHFFRLEPQ